jgi:hypothetical protein
MTKYNFDDKVKELIEGYQFNPEWSEWRKEFSDRVNRVFISYNDYSPSHIVWKGISGGIYFKDVENILDSLFKKSNVQKSYHDNTVNIIFPRDIEINSDLFVLRISDDKDFELIKKDLKTLIDLGAMAFFERYKTLEQVFVDSEKMKIEEVARFIGQPLPLRRMIIKKLCGDKSFDDYSKIIIDHFKKENRSDFLKLSSDLYKLLKDDF